MSTDAKSATSSSTPVSSGTQRAPGIRIFMWPKVIFLYPTAIVALLCSIGMASIHDRTHDPTKPLRAAIDVDSKKFPSAHADLPDTPATSMNKSNGSKHLRI
jgi:hypothetical protein